MNVSWAGPVIILVVAACCASSSCDASGAVRARAGAKQGPLLLLDDMEEWCEAFVGEANGGQEASRSVAARLARATAPAPDDWWLPDPPALSTEVGWSFQPPMARGCNNSAAGTGDGSVQAGEHRGEFVMELLSGPGRHGRSIASPCLTFTPHRGGVVRCRMAVVVNGVAVAEGDSQGQSVCEIGAWIAHCHPKERGRYSQRVGWDSGGMAGTVAFENFISMHEAEFRVEGNVEHLFGTGISVACASRTGTIGVRLWGRVAYLTVELLPE